MYGTSDAMNELLVRQGMTRGTAGTVKPRGIGLEKDGAAKPRQFNREVGRRQHKSEAGEDPFPRLVADNVDVMPTRKDRAQSRPFLVSIEGGRS